MRPAAAGHDVPETGEGEGDDLGGGGRPDERPDGRRAQAPGVGALGQGRQDHTAGDVPGEAVAAPPVLVLGRGPRGPVVVEQHDGDSAGPPRGQQPLLGGGHGVAEECDGARPDRPGVGDPLDDDDDRVPAGRVVVVQQRGLLGPGRGPPLGRALSGFVVQPPGLPAGEFPVRHEGHDEPAGRRRERRRRRFAVTDPEVPAEPVGVVAPLDHVPPGAVAGR